jgi:hypothetical protein
MNASQGLEVPDFCSNLAAATPEAVAVAISRRRD